jgi:ankyrin repeat protein
MKDSYGKTALQVASGVHDAEAVRVLLEADADPNMADEAGETPLHWLTSIEDAHQGHPCAEMHHYAEIARLLIKHGANVNAAATDGSTPIMNALAPAARLH